MRRNAIGIAGCWRIHRVALLAVAATAAFAVLPLPAQSQPQTDEEMPARVARVADFAGDIFLATGDRPDQWMPVGQNYPVASGDNLWVGGEGRAEVDYGGGQFRMGGDTNLNVSRLDDRQLVLFVAQGRLLVRVRVLGPGEGTRIDTPNAQVRLLRPGLYRIDVPPDRATTTVSVREGEAQIAFAGGLQQALPGQSMVLAGPEPEFAEVRASMPRDAFEAWNAIRDRYYEGGPAADYVSPEMVGYADLDHYGAWESYPEYGNVWFPTDVPSGWVPFGDGYWTSVGGWGNTWVDAAPWGYAPSHYGRWVWFGRRWGWCPGRVPVHPAWAPAMVAWFGGNAWGVSLGTPGPVYGWVPLGWREPLQPWWRGCDERCWTRYNRPFSVATPYGARRSGSAQVFVNASVPGALSAVAGATLAERKPVAPNRIALPPRAREAAPLLAEAPPVRSAPPAVSVRPSTRPLPAPASALRPATQADRIPSVPAASPGRGQPAAPVTPAIPAEGRVRTPAGAGVAPAPAAPVAGTPATPSRGTPYPVPPQSPTKDVNAPAKAPAAPIAGAPATPSRGTLYPVPPQSSTKDATAPGKAPPATDERSHARTEPLRSVPVPVTRPAPVEGVAMPPPRSDSARPVPVPPGSVPAAHTDAQHRAAPASPAGAPQGQTPAANAPASQAEGRNAPATHPRDAKDAPANAPATPAAPAGSAR